MNWYIDSSKTDEKYLENVRKHVEPCMNYFCDRVSETEFREYNTDIIMKAFDEIVNELPILTFRTKGDYISHPDDFWITYNRYTQIRFNDGLRSVRRDIILKDIIK